ncbi:hypothetical protein RJ641_009718 [Dillenia turbinata]|uniref:Uncharacterized protein n=1 Tax=Dillenia turbinata TaxID=194707 RepID=A0AAN8VDE1_9MAGN
MSHRSSSSFAASSNLKRMLMFEAESIADKKVHLLEDVAKHNKTKDCWLIISVKLNEVDHALQSIDDALISLNKLRQDMEANDIPEDLENHNLAFGASTWGILFFLHRIPEEG